MWLCCNGFCLDRLFFLLFIPYSLYPHVVVLQRFLPRSSFFPVVRPIFIISTRGCVATVQGDQPDQGAEAAAHAELSRVARQPSHLQLYTCPHPRVFIPFYMYILLI